MKKLLGMILGVLGLNPITVWSLRLLPRYLADRREFRRLGGAISSTFPVLMDYQDQAGTMSGHYYHQDLLVAQLIHSRNPDRHVDVGSRVDGFVAHVASFRPIEIADIRPLESTSKNVSFFQADLMQASLPEGLTDSLSCLHTLEHFGLGRYGDEIDPLGHLKGFRNLVSMVKSGGTFYLSFPISSVERVEFNAHRVFHPESPLGWDGADQLTLSSFHFVDDSGSLVANSTIRAAVEADLKYGCGVYVFQKS